MSNAGVTMRFKQRKNSDFNPVQRQLFNCVTTFLTIILSVQLVSGNATTNVFQSENHYSTPTPNTSGTVSITFSSTEASISVATELEKETENVSGDIGNTKTNIKIDNDVQNIVHGRATETVFSPKNVSKEDFGVSLTDTRSEESKESVRRDENTETNPRSSVRSTKVKTELYSDTNTTKTDDGVAAVNQSAVSTTVTNPKTDTETNRGEEESSTLLVLRLAQCRANCLSKLSGCQDACEFHHYVQHVAKNGTKPPLLAATKVESFLSYNLSTSPSTRKKGQGFQLDLRWPESDGYLVYSVVQHVRLKNTRLGWTWRLLEQTTMGKISLTFSEKPKIENIRVLAASSVNLVHVFSQEKAGVPQNPRSDHHNSEVTKGILRKSEDEQKQSSDSWHLRKVSMVHQKFLVVTEISWDLPENKSHAEGNFSSSNFQTNPKHNLTKRGNDTEHKYDIEEAAPGFTAEEDNNNKSKHRHNFLLTWEVSGGILKGNMVTECDRRCDVTISLWPDTVYSIQVGLIEEKTNGSESRPLNPWEFEGEPKVTMKSSFLSVNTSDVVYLNPSVEKNESDIQSDSRYSSSVHSASSLADRQQADRSFKKIEPISSFSQIQHAAAASPAVSIKENSKNLTTLHGLRCESRSGSLNWLCPSISIADLLFFCSTYGLLLIFFMMFCLWNSCQHYFYNYDQFVSHLRLSNDKKCKLALLRDPQENFEQFPETADPKMKKQTLANLMEYNIV